MDWKLGRKQTEEGGTERQKNRGRGGGEEIDAVKTKKTKARNRGGMAG